MTAPALRQSFHAPGVTAELTWQGWRCRLEIRVAASSNLAQPELNCELLLQPLDDLGRPAGSAARLTTQRVRLQNCDDGTSWCGSLWLPPGINFPLARNCYYRLAKVC